MMRRLVALAVLAAGPSGSASVALAHPVHTSYAELVTRGGTATMTVRAFADDLALAVARFSGQPMPTDSAISPTQAANYLRAMLQVRTADGATVAITPCGVRRAGAMTLLCAQFAWRGPLRLRNRILTDLHADQVNIVQAIGGRTYLFTATSPSQPLVSEDRR